MFFSILARNHSFVVTDNFSDVHTQRSRSIDRLIDFIFLYRVSCLSNFSFFDLIITLFIFVLYSSFVYLFTMLNSVSAASAAMASWNEINLTTSLEPTLERIRQVTEALALHRLDSSDQPTQMDSLLEGFDEGLNILDQMLDDCGLMLSKRKEVIDRKHAVNMYNLKQIEHHYLHLMTNSMEKFSVNINSLAALSHHHQHHTQQSDPNDDGVGVLNLSAGEADENEADYRSPSPVRGRSRQLKNLEQSVKRLMQMNETPGNHSNPSRTVVTQNLVKSSNKSSRKSYIVSSLVSSSDRTENLIKSARKSSVPSVSSNTTTTTTPRTAVSRSRSVGRKVTTAISTSDSSTTSKSSSSPPFVKLLNQNEFESIPGYMRGRAQIDLLNKYVGEFNKALDAKYRFMNRPTIGMNESDLKRHAMYKSQENNETKGKIWLKS